jgi:hypothetical protein
VLVKAAAFADLDESRVDGRPGLRRSATVATGVVTPYEARVQPAGRRERQTVG